MKLFTLSLRAFLLFVFAAACTLIQAQSKVILVDVAHGQKFYSDPADNIVTQVVPADRLKYMTGELTKNASSHKARIAYQKAPFTKEALSKVNLVFIQVPSIKYTPEECKVLREYVEKGGALFIAIEEDYWATLEQVNPNDIVKSFGITFGANSADTSVGGHSDAGKVTKKKYSVPFHGARAVEGGTPFVFSNQSDTYPAGVYTETTGGGRVVAMGEAMVSLYMTEWQGVKDYQCAEFMDDVIGWLLK